MENFHIQPQDIEIPPKKPFLYDPPEVREYPVMPPHESTRFVSCLQ